MYIEREALLKQFTSNGALFTYGAKTTAAIISRINMQPSVDVAPVKHGKWESVGDAEYRCSICKHAPIVDINDNWTLSNFCPNCGTNMKGGIDNGR